MALEQLALLRAEFKERGWNRKATGPMVLELALHTVVALLGYAVCITSPNLLEQFIGLALSTYGTIGVSTNTHTSTHNGTSDKSWVNTALSAYGFPFFDGLSMNAWHNSHLVVHHPAPNVMGVDDDADFSPFFASTDQEIAASRGLWRQYLKVQWIFFPVVVWTHVFLRQRGGYTFLFRALRDPVRRRRRHYLDLAMIVLHYAFWLGVPAMLLPFWQALAIYLLRISFIGYPLFCVLAPGHYPAEAGVVAKGDWSKDFILLQTATTVNFRSGLLGGIICSGLEYQIEHHLFPSYSHMHYRKMSPLVRKFCEQHGYPYRTLGWWEAVWKTCAIFYTPKVVQPNVQAFRNPPRAATVEVREPLIGSA